MHLLNSRSVQQFAVIIVNFIGSNIYVDLGTVTISSFGGHNRLLGPHYC